MARYGEGFRAGRYTRRNVDEFGMGYDSDYVGGGYGYGWGGTGDWRNRSDWATRRPSSIGERWRSQGLGRGYDYDEFRAGRYGGFRSGPYGSSRDWRDRSGESWRTEYGRDLMPGGWHGDYDAGISDRVRRGWKRFRDEARGWMGRGYDRGW